LIYIAFDPIFKHELPKGHRFPMDKYELIPAQLLHEGIIQPENLFAPGKLNEKEILSTHTEAYWNSLVNLSLSESEIRKIGFPLSKTLIEREICIAKGTLEGSLRAMDHGIAFNIAGGTHHAFSYKGEGFCLLNDQAIAAQCLIQAGTAKKILMVDLDVHQGNGTAEIFSKEERVYTFSMHGQNNYPFHKEQSDRDIGLRDQIRDEEYLSILDRNLGEILEQFLPDFIFYQAGVDILDTDALGKLKVSAWGCRQRDQRIIELAYKKGIPMMVCMGGGYSPKIQDIVQAHCNTFRLGMDYFG
jgi:acetoin utilization deacetylase AcuC-like enzyme